MRSIRKCLFVLSVLVSASLAGCGLADESPGSAAGKMVGGVPVGLYFMTRYISGSGLEKMAWYFAPDGTAYENLATGLSAEELAAHKGRKGKVERTGKDLQVTWSSGAPSRSPVEEDATGFGWDMGSFTPVSPIESAAAIAGSYEGGESLSHGGGLVAQARTLELKPDGTYSMDSSSYVSSGGPNKLSGGASSSASGHWTAAGYTITLTDASGKSSRHIAFPYDDSTAKVHPAHLYVGGTMFRHR